MSDTSARRGRTAVFGALLAAHGGDTVAEAAYYATGFHLAEFVDGEVWLSTRNGDGEWNPYYRVAVAYREAKDRAMHQQPVPARR